ncbi:MAG: FtsW/RodA/SpoVE family cell cycle protein, partial [Gemmatimonas sp.]
MLRKQSIDYPLLVIALLLTAFGISMVFSAGQSDVPTAIAGVWKKQLGFFAAALVMCWIATRASVRLLEWSAWPAYAIACVLLLYTKFFGVGAGTAASSHSWIAIGGRRIGQPAELAKIATVLMMARVLASQRDSFKSLFEMWRPLLVIGIPWVLVMLQPDLGTALGFIGICF